jgi:hypothetical protein
MPVHSIWACTGGSYPTVLRYISTMIRWVILCWVFRRPPAYCPEDFYCVAYRLRSDIQERDPNDSVLDLQADC